MVNNEKLIWMALGQEYRSNMIQKGVGGYVDEHGGWIMMPEARGRFEDLLSIRKDIGLDGLIIMAGRHDIAAKVREYRIPTVNLYGGKPFYGLAQVGSDDLAIGKMAGEYLAGLGYDNFAYCGLPLGGFSGSRWVGFRNELQRRNLSVERFSHYKTYRPVHFTDKVYLSPSRSLIPFLAAQPKPLAVFCVSDVIANWVAEACRILEYDIPTKVAILGVNDDVGFNSPSSIRLPNELVGYEAARLLDRMMKGEKPPEKPILLPPEMVVVRRSTDFLAVDDPDAAKAIHFIRNHGIEGIVVEDVLSEVGISRTGLNNKFKAILQHSVFHEIRRVQIDRAKHLLRETEKNMDDIALASGFGSAIHMSIEFKKHTGLAPTAYRKQFREN